ncbi:DUF6233 domain-containing protein [Streptomyces sp. NPDC056004]|uniref:DUF6233 domain-containing protein n=1 Tax=Streptomyces sp. NPDC056004 TaxID=3345677 RepID=UPI0035D75EE3
MGTGDRRPATRRSARRGRHSQTAANVLDGADPVHGDLASPNAGKRRRAIDRDQARALLADGIRACSHCRPDTSLGVLG